MAKKDYIICVIVLAVLIGVTYIGNRWAKVPQDKGPIYAWQAHVDSINKNATALFINSSYPKLILVSKLKDTNMIKWAKQMHINPKARIGYDSSKGMWIIDASSLDSGREIIYKKNSYIHMPIDTTDVRKQDLKWTLKQGDTSIDPIIDHSEIKPKVHKIRFHDSIKFESHGEGWYQGHFDLKNIEQHKDDEFYDSIEVHNSMSKLDSALWHSIEYGVPLYFNSEGNPIWIKPHKYNYGEYHYDTIRNIDWWLDKDVDTIRFNTCNNCLLIHIYSDNIKTGYERQILHNEWQILQLDSIKNIIHQKFDIPLLLYKLQNSPRIYSLYY